MRKFWNKILIVWKDPVWSKVIATGIIVLIGIIWAKYSRFTLDDTLNLVISILSFKVPIYLILSLVGLIYIIIMIIKYFRNRTDIGSEPMGNFTFKELYKILQNQNLPVGTVGMGFSGQQPPQQDLLYLFLMYITYLNVGVTIESPRDDGGYLYGVLCPKLIGYGIVDKIETKNEKIDIVEIKYETSELGKKFYSYVEKITHLNPKRK